MNSIFSVKADWFLLVLFVMGGCAMAVINCVSAEYDSASQDLSNVASELQGAQINDFSEAVETAMRGARAIKGASTTEDCFRSLLVAHSKALYELASAAKAAGVNLQLTEQQNAQAVGNSRSVVVSGSTGRRTAQVFAVA